MAAERAAKRRPLLEKVLAGAKVRQHERLSSAASAWQTTAWTEAELETIKPLAERYRAKEVSQYAACVESRKLLPGRSFEAIRKKIKNWSNYGVWNP